MAKTILIGNICNNSFRNEQGIYVGQATEVALLNVLPILQKDDERKVGYTIPAVETELEAVLG